MIRNQRGTLALWREGSESDTATVDPGDVVRLEISRGRQGHTLQGVLIGVAAGAALGFAVAGVTDTYSSDLDPRPVGAIVGAVLLLPVGAAIGRSIRTERWQEVPLPRELPGGSRH